MFNGETTEEANIDGQWSDWGDYTECDKLCDGGEQSRERKCDQPKPSGSGKQCYGNDTQIRQCNTRKCEG